MAYNVNILLGKIVKVSGYEGAVTVKLDRTFSENIPAMESVFLEVEGRPVPFFIEYSEYSGADILKLKFTGYNSSDQTGEFVGCRVFLNSEMPVEDESDDLQAIIGFDLFDQTKSFIGKIADLIPNHGQMLLRVKSGSGRELLIPLHEDLIISFDREKHTLVMDIPDGLTEIN